MSLHRYWQRIFNMCKKIHLNNDLICSN